MILWIILLWVEINAIIFFIIAPFAMTYLYTHIDELEGPPYGLKEGRLELVKHD